MNSYFLYFYVHINIILIYCRHILLPGSRMVIKLHVILTVTLLCQMYSYSSKSLKKWTKYWKSLKTYLGQCLASLDPGKQFSLTFLWYFFKACNKEIAGDIHLKWTAFTIFVNFSFSIFEHTFKLLLGFCILMQLRIIKLPLCMPQSSMEK